MRDFVLPDFAVYLVMAAAFAAAMITIFSGLIADWLIARQDRKKKAAKAAAEAEAKPG